MENGNVKAKLLDLLQRARADERALMAELSDAEREAVGTLQHWSAKDVLAHITYWRGRLTARLAAVQRGETPPRDDGFDEINAQTFERNHRRAWGEVEADAERVFAELVAQVEQFDNEGLTDPTRYSLRDGDPLTVGILGNSFDHPEIHLVQHYLARGERARALQLQEASTAAQIEFDGSPRSRGAAQYNLACFYALAGESARAIELLRESLGLREDLVEWSKEDTDLVSLRELPEYQALYAE